MLRAMAFSAAVSLGLLGGENRTDKDKDKPTNGAALTAEALLKSHDKDCKTGEGTCCATANVPTPISAPGPRPTAATSYRFIADHKLTINDVPSGAQKVQIWFWLPQETNEQQILNLRFLNVPGRKKIVTDSAGNRCLAMEIDNPNAGTLECATQFELVRSEVVFDLKDVKSTLTNEQREAFADYLDISAETYGITPAVIQKCDEVVPKNLDTVATMRAIYDWVSNPRNTMHYANDTNKKRPDATKVKSSVGIVANMEQGMEGSADYCLKNHGGGCTDQHSLVIAWARMRGVPTRIVFGQRLPAKEGAANASKSPRSNPPYRCYVEYFVSGMGWVPMEASQGGNSPEKQKFYFSGVDAMRVTFARGRNNVLSTISGEQVRPTELFLQGYVLVDGQPHRNFEASLSYNTVK